MVSGNMVVSGLLAASLCLETVTGFYLPGVAPMTFQQGDEIPLLVNHLSPSMYFQHLDENGKTIKSDKERYLYSYDYYTKSSIFASLKRLLNNQNL